MWAQTVNIKLIIRKLMWAQTVNKKLYRNPRNVTAKAVHFRRGLNFFTLSNKPFIPSFINQHLNN